MLQTYISDLVTKEKENKTFLVKKKLQKSCIVGFRKNNTKEERETYNNFRDFRASLWEEFD